MQLAPIIGNPAAPTERFAREFGFNSVIAAPMIREGKIIGAISTAHRDAVPFNDKQVALIKAFADQAVIAIENVRLFNETKEALERQTATAEILKVIASSPADVQPVFDAIVRSGMKLFPSATIGVQMPEGEKILLRAMAGPDSDRVDAWRRSFPVPLTREYVTGAAILDCNVVDIPDFRNAPQQFAVGAKHAVAFGYVAGTIMPMVRAGAAIGAISVVRAEPGPLADREISLLRTFADQAVIAIENVRLFNETKEALERQTATAEILKVISSSPTDMKPVFDAILENALRLCGARLGLLGLYDGEKFQHVAHRGATPEFAEWSMQGPFVPDPRISLGRMIAERQAIHHQDLRESTGYREGAERAVRMVEMTGVRSYLAVPMLKEGLVIGGIVIYRVEVRPFTQKQIDLVATFADQAVIAIENVRLFKELEARTAALAKSVNQLTALGEVGQAISSTLELETVLQTIVSRAVQLSGLDGGSIYEYDEQTEEFRLQAAENMDEELADSVRKAPIRKGDGAVGRTGITREPTQVPDIDDESYQSGRKELLVRAGYRAVLAVPLLREDHIIGALAVTRKTPGPFAPEIVELLKTFAAQSALAIQNARLFREIAEKGRQLEVAGRHKSEFLASMSHELRTPLNAILGFNEMILGQVYGEVPTDMQAPLAEIQSGGKHLLRLINNVLDLAKIEAGRMELALSDYSVQDTVEAVRSTLRPLAADKGLEFLATVPPDIPLAYGDPGRISQCLVNLAGNSLKFTKAGKVEISVEQKDGLLTYRVLDTGIGIPPDKIGSLFTEFKQTDATIASEYGGTGLGLSISKKFIEMHGGRIWVESEPGEGSSFIFEVPLRVKGQTAGGAPA
jgi:signal transduction histidine kinase